ncbi:MAG TPA: DUF4126 domain-containing protein [bacterium]|nr:DUF4126 domain-containing protein [bacterium]
MDVIEKLGLLLGPSFLSGINAYATIGFLGLFGRVGWLTLPKGLDVLSHPLVFGIALGLFLIEFVADKIPAFDSFWHSLQTFVRIPCGALLAYAVAGPVAPHLKVAAFLLGGTLAASSHGTKAGLRAIANLSPEPVSNWLLSFGEDAFLFVCIWLIFYLPLIMLGILVVFIVLAVWLFPKMFRAFKAALNKGARLFRPSSAGSPPSSPRTP